MSIRCAEASSEQFVFGALRAMVDQSLKLHLISILHRRGRSPALCCADSGANVGILSSPPHRCEGLEPQQRLVLPPWAAAPSDLLSFSPQVFCWNLRRTFMAILSVRAEFCQAQHSALADE